MSDAMTDQRPGVILSCRDLVRTFSDGELSVEVLKGISLDVNNGENLAIIGSSGSGKSTLLHCLGGLDKPTSGSVTLAGNNLFAIREQTRNQLRNRSLGFVYQFHHLLQELTAVENVAMPLLIRGVEKQQAAERARHWLDAIEMDHRAEHRPSQLSGGERQRVALARALAGEPQCVLADEPTGNLDRRNADRIYDLMLKLTHDLGTAFVVVTHDQRLTERMDRVVTLKNG
ncbi:MAG: lipoprotein-releasing ABC transporter ATP-binding protein LolD, partial [Pseudomonadota bacterium]